MIDAFLVLRTAVSGYVEEEGCFRVLLDTTSVMGHVGDWCFYYIRLVVLFSSLVACAYVYSGASWGLSVCLVV